MRKFLLLPLILMTLGSSVQASDMRGETILRGQDANQEIEGATVIRYKAFSSIPAYIQFQETKQIDFEAWQSWITSRFFKDNDNISFELIGDEHDQLGMTHYRYQQTSQGYPLAFGIWLVHVKAGMVVSMNGELFDEVQEFTPALSEAGALNQALSYVGASSYKWQIAQEEADLKMMMNDPTATYYPEGKLVIVNRDPSLKEVDLKLAWRFNIYAHEPMSRTEVYVDATSGNTVFTQNLIQHGDSVGTATTNYNGTFNIVADYTGSNFRLRESGRGDGVSTYDLNGSTSGLGGDFTDNDNIWNSTQSNMMSGPDAHYGAEMTYDFYFDNFGRNSIDDNGFELISRVNYGVGFNNAFWNGQYMTYGSGGASFAAIDVAGHEVSHGLTEHTANLVYESQSGALNESFSDIFGAAIEFYAEGSINDWTMGEDMGWIIRYMNNPNLGGDPDTYEGQNWINTVGCTPSQGNDQCGVHTNSGVQNFWFYLLTAGGNGTNDNGDSYSVTGIGIEDAQAIAFRNLTVYLTTTSQYEDARFYALQSAIDLFGVCTQQLESTADAWYAVGVGNAFVATVDADFAGDDPESCILPHTVNFTDYSSNTDTYAWDFGDGSTSTVANPSHTYTQAGTYTVKLTASSTCGSDTKSEVSYVKVGPEVPCKYIMEANGQGQTQENCIGYVYDNGGPNGNYLPQSDSYVTIAPCGASTVTVTFEEFQVEQGGSNCEYDKLTVYDGSTTSGSTIIGEYCNSNPPPNTITSTGAAITIRLESDGGLEHSGFKISWECEGEASLPEAAFSTIGEPTCNGFVQFSDESVNCPEDYLWNFGDGNTSTDANPSHQYLENGTYGITLTVSNDAGTDSIADTAYITINRQPGPVGENQEICPGDIATLSVVASIPGETYWYDAPYSTVPIAQGNSYTTPVISYSTGYYVETVYEGESDDVGPSTNGIGGGGNYDFQPQSQIFDAYQPFILKSVKVYASGTADRTIEMRDANGNVLESTTVNISDGTSVVDLDFFVEPGTDLQLGLSNSSEINMYRNNSGVDYPYELDGIVSIKRSTANQNGGLSHYYFFYDWEIATLCASERKTIIASTGVCTGFEELTTSRVDVYPNPTHGEFEVVWEGMDVTSIQLYNQQGQIVLSERPIAQGKASIDQPLAKGVYILTLKSEQSSTTQKVVVQ